MTLQSDMDSDRSAVFLDTDEFATTVTYVQRDGTSLGSIEAIRTWPEGASEIGMFGPMDARTAALYHVSAADVTTPLPLDRITDGNDTFQVANVAPVDGMFELRCVRMKDTQ